MVREHLKILSRETSVIPVGGSFMYISAKEISHATLYVQVLSHIFHP